MAWVWIKQDTILAIHDSQILEHGGQAGIRDMNLLESALARPVNKSKYGDVSVADLAAAYSFGIARNHPFLDGNKRTAFVAAELFLALNGYEFTADDATCVTKFLDLAEGSLSETELVNWLCENISLLDDDSP